MKGVICAKPLRFTPNQRLVTPCLDPSQSEVVCDSGQNSRDETNWRAGAAEAALSAHLRVLADQFAAPALVVNRETA